MVCRVRTKLTRGSESIESIALINSGFESDAPDIVIPLDLAKRFGLWPPRSATATLIETGGGEVLSPYYISFGDLELVLEDRESKKVRVNIIVNPHVDEVVISDYVASELGVILLDLKKGEWRLRDDSPEKVRTSIASK
ncbi:MAG: hypothetical protein QXI11_02510 [Thermoproteota archaeon]